MKLWLLRAALLVASLWGVANVAGPLLAHGRLRSRTAAIVADVHRVHEAALAFRSERGYWPAEERAGLAPVELAAALEGNVAFRGTDTVFDWENWVGAGGTLRYPSRGVAVGLSLRTHDEALLRMVERHWGAPLPRRGGGATFPFASSVKRGP